MILKSFKYPLLFLLILLLLCIAYWPVIVMDYVYHDDVNYFMQTATQKIPPSQMSNFAVGRFIGAGIITGYSQFVHSVADLKFIRFMSVLQFAFSAFLLFFFLKQYLSNTLWAVVLSITIFTLPPFQTIAAHAGMCFQAYAIPFALCAAILAHRIPTTGPLWKRSIHFYTLTSLIFMTFALATYPPTATFFWVPVALVILSLKSENLNILKSKLLNFFYVGFASLGIYWILLQFIKKAYSEYWHGMYNPSKLETHFLEKFIWFLKEPLYNAANLWNIFPNMIVPCIIGFIILSTGGWIMIRHRQQKGILSKSLFFIALFFILFVLSFLPNLLASGKAPFYRCSAALTSMIIVVLLWALKEGPVFLFKTKRNIIISLILIGGCLWGMFQAGHTLYYYRAFPSHVEFNYLKDALLKGHINKYERVHLLRTNVTKYRYDEFGSPTTRFVKDTLGIVTCALREIGKGTLELHIVKYNFNTHQANYLFKIIGSDDRFIAYKVKISSTVKDNYTVFDDTALIIDMTEIYKPSYGLNYLLKNPNKT